MNYLVILRLGDKKVIDHLTPLLQTDQVERLYMVRHGPVSLPSPKLVQITHQDVLKKFSFNETLTSLVNIVACMVQGFRVARKTRPQAVIAFNLVPYGILAWLIGKLNHSKVIVSLIGTDYNRHVKSELYGSLLRRILRACDAVTIFGNEERIELAQLAQIPKERVVWLPNAIDTSCFQPDPSIQPTYDFIFVGRLVNLKRVNLLLESLKIVLDQRPQTTLRIVGDGPNRKQLETLAEQLRISEHVVFSGWSDNPVNEFRSARIFVSLSASEGIPMTIIEAMCTGLVPVVTNVGAIGLIVCNGKNGFLLGPTPTPQDVAERLLALLDDQTLFKQLQGEAVKIRDDFNYAQASHVWSTLVSKQ